MANNSKSAGTTSSASERGLEAKLSEALEKLYSGQDAKAQGLLQALGQQASEAGDLVMARRVRTALMSISRKGTQVTMVAPASSEMAVQVYLNQGETKEALALVEEALKTAESRASLHYLKALILAQLGEAEPSAESLKQAIALEPGLHHQFLLEKDFDGVRAAAVFGEFERI